MTSSSAIPRFGEIADLYGAAGFQRVPDSADFDLLRLESGMAWNSGASALGPHRRGFFQFTYIASEAGDRNVLLAAAPDQVLSNDAYLRPSFAGQQGYTALFKASVIGCQLASPTNEFPFFYQPASLEVPGSEDARGRLLPQLRALEATSSTRHPYRTQKLAALLAALLYDVRLIFEQAEKTAGEHQLCAHLACRFEDVVLQHFQTHHSVEDYARLLHVSADHLSAEVKAKTGRNAREVIAERLTLEAKHLLTYTELTIAEISDQLGFGEPTHFSRYFKRHLKEGPLEFRRRVQRHPTDRISSESVEERQAAAV